MTSRTSRATRVPGARHWPLTALLLASVLWGGAITGTKYALRAFDPVTLLSVELAAATAALSASLYSVVAKRFADDSDALSLTTWQFTAATAVALAVAAARWAGHPDRLPIAVAPRYWLAASASEWAASR